MEFAPLLKKVKPVLTVSDTLSKSYISLTAAGEPMLEVREDGFYVRGVKLEQDEKEAREVYESFKAWLAWAQLNRV